MPSVDSTGKDAMAGPCDSPVVHPDTNEPPIIVPCSLRLERFAAAETSTPLHDPGAVHLKPRLMPVEVWSGEQIALLQAERCPRSQADRPDPELRPALQM